MSGFAEEPRAIYSARMGKAEFFAWLHAREGVRYELKNAAIVVHAGSTIWHARISSRFLTALNLLLDKSAWEAIGPDFAVEIGDDIRYPDVMVIPAIVNSELLSTSKPVLLVEVLSPTSAGRDMHEKLAEYIGLASLEAYIVASQDEPIVWVWQRETGTHTFPSQPVEIAGLERAIAIDALGISLPLAEIYRGITDA